MMVPEQFRPKHTTRQIPPSVATLCGIDHMDEPLKALCELGGWKDPQTVLRCYQHPDQDALRITGRFLRRPLTISDALLNLHVLKFTRRLVAQPNT